MSIKASIDELNIAGEPLAIDELHERKKKPGNKGYDFGVDNELHDDPNAIDELKVVESKRKVLSIEQFFEPMVLTDLQRKNRIELARKLEDDFMFMLYWLDTYDKSGLLLPHEKLIDEYVSRVEKSVGDKYLNEYRKGIINSHAIDFADVMARHKGEEWYVSPERATVSAENTANDIMNDVDYESAVTNGIKYKKWYTVLDGKERQSHADIDGKKIPINDLFFVGGSIMRYPRDEMYGANAAEIINCRCSLIYS